MRLELILSIINILLFGLDFTQTANWAVLVAGSNGWYNYRHQADVCHAYQILHKNGIPDSNIIVMMYDDIANNVANPTKGVIINHPQGDDVYHGVLKDYTGTTVTPEIFLNVLLGNKTAMQGIGSGKVLESGPDDNVFIFFTDHGATGLVAFPTSVLYATDLNTTITKMYNQKQYKQMVVYIEACESGSMFENILSTNINIYATTASDAEESSYACYYDEKLATYLGDCYSVSWMENSDEKRMFRETLYEQYVVARRKTHESHVMEYGNLEIGKSQHIDEFQGNGKPFHKKNTYTPVLDHFNTILKRDAVATEDVRIAILTRRLSSSNKNNSLEYEQIQQELKQALHERSFIHNRIEEIVSRSLTMNDIYSIDDLTQKRMKLTQYDRYKSITQYLNEKCFDLQNEFVLSNLWLIANLCEINIDDITIKHAIDQTCLTRFR